MLAESIWECKSFRVFLCIENGNIICLYYPILVQMKLASLICHTCRNLLFLQFFRILWLTLEMHFLKSVLIWILPRLFTIIWHSFCVLFLLVHRKLSCVYTSVTESAFPDSFLKVKGRKILCPFLEMEFLFNEYAVIYFFTCFCITRMLSVNSILTFLLTFVLFIAFFFNFSILPFCSLLVLILVSSVL